MAKSSLTVVLLSIVILTASPAIPAIAQCPSCSNEDWSSSAQAFIEGSTPAETPATWGPQAARMKNSQFSTERAKEQISADSSGSKSSAQVPDIDISLKDASAMPNKTRSESPVNITAVFSSPSKAFNETEMESRAIIRNSSGIDVGEVKLQRKTEGAFVGNWSASLPPGVYTVAIVASEAGRSKTFEDAMTIEVL